MQYPSWLLLAASFGPLVGFLIGMLTRRREAQDLLTAEIARRIEVLDLQPGDTLVLSA